MSQNDYDLKSSQVNRTLKGFANDERHRQYKKVAKKIKRNRDPRPPRRKDWIPENLENLDDLDDLDLPAVERVMSPGESDRRKHVAAIAARAIEDEPTPAEPPSKDETGVRGMVVEVSNSLARVNIGDAELLCRMRGSLSAHDTAYTNVVAIGDEVIISDDTAGGGVVEKVLPRRSALTRPDVYRSHLRQVIAANVDQLLIIAAWREPDIWTELIDRYLIAAERNNLTPILCVNKIDLAEDRAACQEVLQPYADLGLHVLFTSAQSGEGIDDLKNVLQGCSTVLAGLSGVGKSSLLTAVQPDFQLRTHEVSEHSGAGQHTTTQATLLPLGMGGYVIDTPGIREFGLNGLHRGDLRRFYPEMDSAAEHCRFADCAHLAEPDCAVRQGVHQGTIPRLRYDNYRKICESLPA